MAGVSPDAQREREKCGEGVPTDQKSAIWSHLLPIKGGRTQFSFNTFQKWNVVFQDMA